MSEQTSFTLGEAANVTGRSKSTISKAISSGRLSVRSKEAGSYQIDAAELFRVYPRTEGNPVENRSRERLETPEIEQGNTVERAKIEYLTQRLADIEAMSERERRMMSEQIEELRRDRDRWAEQAGRLALTHQPQTETAPAAPETPAKAGFSFLGFEIRRKGF